MHPTPVELVRAHARAHALLALQRIIVDPSADTTALQTLSADAVEEACLEPAFRTWAAELALSDSAPNAQMALQIIASTRRAPKGVNGLPVTKSLQRIVGPRLSEMIIDDLSAVNTAWMTAQHTVERLRLGNLVSVLQAVDLITGLDGPWGEVRAFSNPQFPGFVAIGVNNPPIVLAEQAVHEAGHVTFAAHIALDAGLGLLTDERVGVLSPFTSSVRTIERVAHGIFSYAAVRELWRAVARDGYPELLIEVPDRGRALEIVARRLKTLDARLSLAITCLFDAAGTQVCDLLKRLAGDILAAELEPPVQIASQRREIVAAAGYPLKASGLDPLQRAEFNVAAHGDKVSRISIPFADISRDAFALLSSAGVVASSWVIRSIPDPRIGNFSNLSGEQDHVLNADAESEVHLYIHCEPSLARQAALLDREDQAGELLGIPSCCREWFAREWPRASTVDGDAFAVMIRQNARNGSVTVASECDASAMYRGGGLCWHFPCSPFCPETIGIVRSRRERLAVSDLALLRELDSARRRAITILADGTHIDGVRIDQTSVIVQFE